MKTAVLIGASVLALAAAALAAAQATTRVVSPLYRFYLDRKRGDVLGNGFRDVGVWRPVAVSRR